MPKQRLYFDYAASTPVAPEVEAVMRPYFLSKFGNAGSLHSFGQEAIAALDESRETIANAIGAGFREVIFTGSATEANNLALRGVIKAHQRITNQKRINEFVNSKRIRYSLMRPRLIISAIEHESVLETARDLEKEGVEVIYIPVSKKGIVDLKKLKESLNERTILVSVMYANNEIGTIQPLFEIKKIISDFKKRKSEILNSKSETNSKPQIPNNKKVSDLRFVISDLKTAYPLFHTDAVQAFQFLDCDVKKLGVDLMTLSGHKIYGPKGVGALYVNNELRITNNGKNNKNPIIHNSSFTLHPLITGGGQEFGLRSGTENVPLIVGFAKAVSLVSNSRELENKRISKLRDYLWEGIKKIYPRAQTNPGLSTNNESKTNKRIRPPALLRNAKRAGKFETNSLFADTLPNFLNIYFPDYKAEDLLVRLDLAGIAVSTGSACSARSTEPSYVIKALGLKGEQSSRSIRITLGRQTSKRDIDTALKIIKNVTRGQHNEQQ
ncbi:MAG: cysteine desulfurase family protein [bacterium]|nr:cysteine desulfurase family protein [bacterium]